VTQKPDKIDADWPDDPQNAALERFARDVFGGAPQLPQIALDRVRVNMGEAIEKQARWRRWRNVLGAMAASVALMAGVYAIVMRDRSSPRSPPVVVEDRYEVAMPPAPATAPDKPLIDVDGYGELYGRQRSAQRTEDRP
jgi:hypothetical protein